MTVHDAGSWVIVLCAVLSLTFVVGYHFSALWWKTEVGKHLMSIAASEAAILTTQSIRVISGVDSQCFEIFRLIVFLSFPMVLSWRLMILWKLQIRPKRRIRKESGGWTKDRVSSRPRKGRRTPD